MNTDRIVLAGMAALTLLWAYVLVRLAFTFGG